LVHIEMRWVEVETATGFCIVHGFDFEDSKGFVRPCCHRAGCRVVPFADADLMVGNSDRLAREGGRGESAEREGHSDEHFGQGRFISRFEDQWCKEVEG
jgi:hypothetical protein